ncbi:MAG: alpha-ketoglutarate-dependent dioxygenase AlkB [Bacteroidetes bacterium]|nr:alpha-ketoglutarate-dependent dioxygenase AlkB [Bacteroidota bacterium]MDA0888373.1 alpha-ketoglutarate-dependent dioxygenase AlkB [Bacteroidota bacterium]MDA1084433.1 alpha-ketoglutarate-dependent dioxygenase AlkB [Bacteroidota bacterium]
MSLLFDVFEPKLPDATIRYYPNFLTKDIADSYFLDLLNSTPWQNDPITVFGKTYPQPRMTSLHGHTTDLYGYSGIVMQPNPMTKSLLDIETKIQTLCEEHFTTVLLNLYRTGKDSNGWHADDEPELGQNPIIASVSLGAERYFHLKHNQDKSQRLKFALAHGSLLLMEGSTQHHWKHQIAKTAREVGPRINLTFRKVIKAR